MTLVSASPTSRFPRSVGAILLVAVAAACAPEDDRANVDDATRARVVAAASPAATTLAGTLSGQLMAAVNEGGPAHAIGFCANEALVLTDSVAGGLGAGWQVKRTARRTRNPANAPDDLEEDALDRFHAAETDGEGLEDLVQRTPDGDFRYYRPLRIAPLCAECHGPRDAMQPAVLEAIDERYPDDDATGYTVGELRGLIRITVPAAAIDPA
ncbi:MAG TPA: DUF3365 domain-containing protein [Longimicrobiales bacterium]|nr:DUF3365 domain-containing protein [Longimicrobiales bacterium]